MNFNKWIILYHEIKYKIIAVTFWIFNHITILTSFLQIRILLKISIYGGILSNIIKAKI